jgi:hypothetical protein
VLLGYGSVFGVSWHFYLFTAFFIILPFMLIAGIIAVMVLMSIIKLVSRIGVRWVLAIIITGLSRRDLRVLQGHQSRPARCRSDAALSGRQ